MEKPILGIIMGQGDLPLALVEECQRKKRPYVLFPIISQANQVFVQDHPHAWISFGHIKKNIMLLKKHRVTELVFVGSVRRPAFFFLNLDWLGWQWLFSIGWKALGDDGLLSGIIKFLEKENFRVIGVHELVPKLLMPYGKLGKIEPSSEDKENIAVGFRAAKKLGDQDIGQGVIVDKKKILAKETVDGTDWMLKQASLLLEKPKSAILVKTCKPHQEKRIDLPTIGPQTIENLANYGYKGVALEAQAGLVLHPEKVRELADQKGIFVYGVTHKKK